MCVANVKLAGNGNVFFLFTLDRISGIQSMLALIKLTLQCELLECV